MNQKDAGKEKDGEENQGKGEEEKERNPPLLPLWPSRIDLYSYKTQESIPPIGRYKNKSTADYTLTSFNL
jgi:hypothetical protein